MKQSFISAAAAFLVLLTCAAIVQPGASSSTDELVRRLGSDSFLERTSATEELLRREEARPDLEKAILSRDPEIAARARRIIDDFDRRRSCRLVSAARASGKANEVDCLVAAMTYWMGPPEDTRYWEMVVDLSIRLLSMEKKKYGKVSASSEARPVGLSKQNAQGTLDRGRIVAAPCVTGRSLDWEPHIGLMFRTHEFNVGETLGATSIVCSGKVRLGKLVSGTLFGNGEVCASGNLCRSIVVCDGDLTAGSITESLVIARGTVRTHEVWRSTILCGQDVEIYKSIFSSALICGKTILRPKHDSISGNTLKENAPEDLSFVKFFETREAGVEVQGDKHGVLVNTLHRGKRLTTAVGLEEGDLIAAVHGESAKTPESFRQLLRKRLVVNEPFTMDVRRAGLCIALKVAAVK